MSQKLQILMVEDQATEADVVAWNLRKGGVKFEIKRVETEADFRQALREGSPDIILSDFTLPRFDGMTALRIASELAPDIPFVFVSGTIGEERAIEALRRGATDYVLKSNLARLIPAIQRALREAAMNIAHRRAEKTLQDIVNTSQDWIWQLDVERRFTFSSPAIATILGYEPDELLGKHFDSLLHDEDRASAESRLPSVADGSQSLSGAVARWRHRDGQSRWLERNAIVITGADGKLLGYRGSDRDVTVRREQDARIQRLNRTHRMLSSISSAIVRMPQRDELLEEACRIAVQQGGYGRTSISLVTPGTATVHPVAWAGKTSQEFDNIEFSLTDPDPVDNSMTVRAIRSGVPVICNDLLADSQAVKFRDRLVGGGFRAAAVLPLLVDRTAIGAIMLCAAEPGVFDAAEVAVLQELVANISFALQYFEKESAVEFLSYFDANTGLAKRALFCERLARVIAADSSAQNSISIVVFDVQHLSLINDTFGRHVTDRLLQQIADRMKNVDPDALNVAQFGGGTFAAAFSNVEAGTDTSRLLLNQAAQFFAEPFTIDGHEIRPSVRSGAAYFPDNGQTADTLVQNAEAALKHAKDSGEPYVPYSLVDNEGSDERIKLEARLGNALEREQFVLHYQPKINLASGRVEGVEALLRWQDPTSGLVAPNVFIPLLESTGMIVEVGQWVLEQASRDCREWLRLGLPPIRVAVNVSPFQLRRREFVDRTIATTRSWATERTGLDLEITESMLMRDFDASARKLEALRDAGLRIAIDDFGTGYSSLRRLATLPIDTLKIDHSFIRGIVEHATDRAIVKTIISLARSFNMTTVAEGVETEDQLALLKAMRCDQVQGYLFSKPVPAGAIPDLLHRLNVAAKPQKSATAKRDSLAR
jgi:PAS domain S-box-containing protein/diguanylate cyclase (GGDEF)-like protein